MMNSYSENKKFRCVTALATLFAVRHLISICCQTLPSEALASGLDLHAFSGSNPFINSSSH